MDGDCRDKKTVKGFDRERTKDRFMNKMRYKRVMILVGMCLE